MIHLMQNEMVFQESYVLPLNCKDEQIGNARTILPRLGKEFPKSSDGTHYQFIFIITHHYHYLQSHFRKEL